MAESAAKGTGRPAPTAIIPPSKTELERARRQVAMVFDLNKCLGCQTCVIACKTLWTRNEGMEYM
ncbi:MAG: hypothetical protein D6722_01565, partial [Bacteroidetes bacterium]